MKLSIATPSTVAHVFSVLMVETTPEGDVHIEATPDMYGTLEAEADALVAACKDRMPYWGDELGVPNLPPLYSILEWVYQDSMWETVRAIRVGDENPV